MLPTNQTSSLSSERWLIPINIETLAGSSFELLVSPHEQIQSIKRRIEQREGIPVSHQYLVWKSTELDDESCLHDYNIEAGTTLRLVLAMRGGPVNTKRVPIEDGLLRDMSEYFDNSRDDGDLSSDLLPPSNKNVTFLVLRDGDQFNFFQVIDRGDGTLSPLSGSVSNASMYNTHETLAIEPEREYDEKRQADDRKTKQKMELIRSKLKTHARKEALPLRPPSATKPSKSNLLSHPRRNLLLDRSSNVTTKSTPAPANPSQDQHRSIPMTFSSTNLLNSYNILAAAAMGGNDLLHEEDSEDDDDSHDEDDDPPSFLQSQQQQPQFLSSASQQPLVSINPKKSQLLTSRSFSPAVFYHKKHHSYEQEPSKKSLYHSHYQDRSSKNMVTKHDSTDSLDSYAPNSINTILSTSYPSVATRGSVSQETAMTATTAATATSTGNDTSASAVLVDYIPRISPTLHKQQVPMVTRSSRILSAISSKRLNTSKEASAADSVDATLNHLEETGGSNSEILYQASQQSPILDLIDDDRLSPSNGLTSATSGRAEKIETSRKQTAEMQSRNDTSLSRPIWTDDDDPLVIGDEFTPGERTSTGQSTLFRHRNSSTSTTIPTPAPTFPGVVKKSTLPSSTQQFYHYHKPLNTEQQSSKASPRASMPTTLSKYPRIPANVHLPTTTTTTATQSVTYPGAAKLSSSELSNNAHANATNSTDSFNEHLMLNKRIEVLKTPAKQPQSTAPSPSSSSTASIFPSSSSLSKRHFQQQDVKSVGATATVPPSSSSHNALDNTTVTIESIGSKTVTALFRQNATIEPVDTSRGVGKHLFSLLTTASKESTSMKTGHKHSSRDAVIEERYKLDPKSTNPWSNSPSMNYSTVSSSVQSTTAMIYNANKLPPVNVNRKSTSKCFLCKKKTGLATTYQCRCGSSFCSEHRYPEAHACAFDYKAEGKRLIERNNPLVTAPKLPKI